MELRRARGTSSVRTEGGLLPADLLAKVAAADRDVPGLADADYALAAGDRVREGITRSWNRLVGSWAALTAARVSATDEHEPLTTPTRERWLLPLFEELGFGRLTVAARAVEIEGTAYPISHAWEQVPIHLVGFGIELDRRTPGVRGAAGAAPHALVQEYLNRSDEALWGIVSNGRLLRLLRDSTSLTRQAFVEFDLEAIFEGELFADFALLWSVCHRTRFDAAKPEECLLERWSKKAADDGTRALDKLRGGVERAIETLGTGFLVQPTNAALREALRSGDLDRQDYYRELLRLVYRLIFLFTAEDRRDETTGRELLLDPAAPDEAAERYRRHYSTARLRSLAGRRRGTRHPDLWVSLRRVIAALGGDGAPTLALPALGSFLFGPTACPHLDAAELRNEDLLDTVRALATIEEDRRLRLVDYRNLGAEELGGIYEGLLELHPRIEVDATPPRFTLGTAAGNERKATGSYYTPTSLITCLLDSALDPVVDEAVRGKDRETAERALLELAIVDPAAGSGHFVVAAAHRLAKRLASIRTDEGEPAPSAVRRALRDVIAHCIYAVDVNPMAVELCKVSLWLEALEPGRPLSFLDAHVKVGNSLLGTTPQLAAAGIPDAAYEALTGDDKAVARAWRDRNRQERDGQRALFEAGFEIPTDALAAAGRELEALPETDRAAVSAKSARHRALLGSPEYRRARLALDAWCAAFVAPKVPREPEITTAVVRTLAANPEVAASAIRDLVEDLAASFGFFHWELEFPAVFDRGGFDVVVGNPPFLNAIEGIQGRRTRPVIRTIHPAVGGTGDLAFFFLSEATRIAGRRGRIGMVQPRAVLNAESMRRFRGSPRDALRPNLILLPESSGLFAGAAVFVCALVLGPNDSCVLLRGLAEARLIPAVAFGSDNWWSALDTEPAPPSPEPTELAKGLRSLIENEFAISASMITAEAYEVAPFVVDEFGGVRIKLVTTGLIDPARCLWGQVNCRYLKRDFLYPRIDEHPGLSRSLLARLHAARRPKILVAGLSKRVECYLDARGEFVGAVSTFTIYHHANALGALEELLSRLLEDSLTRRFVSDLGANALGGGSITMRKDWLKQVVVDLVVSRRVAISI